MSWAKPIAHAVDRGSHEDERGERQQQAGKAEARVSGKGEPAGALPAGPGLHASVLGHWREAIPLLPR